MSLLLAVPVGAVGTSTIIVDDEHTAPFVGSGRVRVLATPVMINLIEAAALEACEHLLPTGHQSLGTHLDVTHIAATPVGLRVRPCLAHTTHRPRAAAIAASRW